MTISNGRNILLKRATLELWHPAQKHKIVHSSYKVFLNSRLCFGNAYFFFQSGTIREAQVRFARCCDVAVCSCLFAETNSREFSSYKKELQKKGHLELFCSCQFGQNISIISEISGEATK